MEYAIEVENVKKNFKVHLEKSNLLKDAVVLRNRNKVEEREIIKGISFKIRKGEAVGLIGKNGCGKSTTLKMLTRILNPNEGSLKIEGRVSSLIELGAGFHPDMSGRENVYINASIFGISRKEVDMRFDDIVRFSELEEYIDNPVRTYSSGMYMRLAFSVAINVDADILLIDEILAVGDTSFQKKCFERLKKLKCQGTTIVIVSHSLDQVKEICDRAIWIDAGIVREDGNPELVCADYLAYMEDVSIKRAEQEYNQRKKNNAVISDEEIKQKAMNESCHEICVQSNIYATRVKNGKAGFSLLTLCDMKGESTLVYYVGQGMKLEFAFSEIIREEQRIVIELYREGNVLCWGKEIIGVEKKECCLLLPKGELLSGKYWFDICLYNSLDNTKDELKHIIEFTVSQKVQGRNLSYGMINMCYEIE